MIYKNISTPEQLMKYMNENISYGIYDYAKNKKYLGENKNFELLVNTIWKLSSPKQMQEHGIGHCYDQVEFERAFFTKKHYNFKTFFIWFKCTKPNIYPTHTYLVYQEKRDNKWCWFEHSDSQNRGIHKFNSLNEAIEAQKLTQIKYAKSYRKAKTDISKIQIFEYTNIPYGCDINTFTNIILQTGKEISI